MTASRTSPRTPLLTPDELLAFEDSPRCTPIQDRLILTDQSDIQRSWTALCGATLAEHGDMSQTAPTELAEAGVVALAPRHNEVWLLVGRHHADRHQCVGRGAATVARRIRSMATGSQRIQSAADGYCNRLDSQAARIRIRQRRRVSSHVSRTPWIHTDRA